MPTTVKTLIDAAWTRSSFNDPETLAKDPELIGVADRRMKQLYSLVSRINPLYFGKRAKAGYDPATTGWPRPADAEMVVAAYYTATGDRVEIVPFDDREVTMAPRIYEFGQIYYSVGTAADPTAEDIDFFYSKQHPDLDPALPASHATNTLDPSWPEQFNDLVILHLARYLAVKDQREGEVAVLAAEEAALMQVFQQHLAHENYGMKARWGRRSGLSSVRPDGFLEE